MTSPDSPTYEQDRAEYRRMLSSITVEVRGLKKEVGDMKTEVGQLRDKIEIYDDVEARRKNRAELWHQIRHALYAGATLLFAGMVALYTIAYLFGWHR